VKWVNRELSDAAMGADRQVLRNMLGAVTSQQLEAPQTMETGARKVTYSSDKFGFEIVISEVKDVVYPGHVIELSGRQPTLSGDIRYQDQVEIPSDPEILRTYFPNGVVDFTGFQQWSSGEILEKVKAALAADAAMGVPNVVKVVGRVALALAWSHGPVFYVLNQAGVKLPTSPTEINQLVVQIHSIPTEEIEAAKSSGDRTRLWVWANVLGNPDAKEALKTLQSSDKAQQDFTRGGIDLNAASLDLQIRRDGNGVPLPVSQQNLDNIKIDGLVPVILNIRSAAGLPLFSELPGPSGGTNA
jgi:hypothetical protein